MITRRLVNFELLQCLHLVGLSILIIQTIEPAVSQSVGYHPNFNLGFNPYLSETFGYGLGLPFGAYGMSYTSYPWLSIHGFSHGGSLVSKLHAKQIAKKLGSTLYSAPVDSKGSLALKKHPEYSMIPSSFDYGYGKHYGSAQVPNNPYKSAYGDFYVGHSTFPMIHEQSPYDGAEYHIMTKPYKYIKPILKAGALIGTAALINKKFLSLPEQLDPAGMIMGAKQILNKN